MKPFRITSLEAHQIGPFGDLKMVFPEKPKGMADKAEVHILTGENGVGKSTVLEMLLCAATTKLEVFGNRFREGVNGNNFIVKFSNIEPFNFKETLEKFNSGQYLLKGTHLKEPFHFGIFSYSGYRKIEHSSLDLLNISSPLESYAAPLFTQSPDPQLILSWIGNSLYKGATAQSDSDLEGSNRCRKSVSQLENAISKIVEYPIKFQLEYAPPNVIIEVNHERLDFNQLPDGLKSIISWLADLLMRMDRVKWVDDIPVFERNFMLFLDEIEVHMHPKWQRKILPAVQGLFPNAQIFISTHSPFVIGSVDGAWIHKLVKPNGDSIPDGEPIPSEDGNSVHYILEEIFGVKEQFGEGVEQELKKFYALRDEVFKSPNGTHTDELLEIARKIGKQSTELWQIMEMEIRQVNRRKELNLTL